MMDITQPEVEEEMESTSLRPHSTFSHLSIAEEYAIESRCTTKIHNKKKEDSPLENDITNVNKWAGDRDLNKSTTPMDNWSLRDCIDYISMATNPSRLENNNYSDINMSSSKF